MSGRYGIEDGKKLSTADYNKMIVEATKVIDEQKQGKLDTAAAYCSRGLSHYHFGRYSMAVSDETKALSLIPHFTEALYLRAAAYYCLEDDKNAFADATMAQNYKPFWTPKEDFDQKISKLLKMIAD